MLDQLNPNDAAAIRLARDAIHSPTIIAHLVQIDSHFHGLVDAICRLETQGNTLTDSIKLIDSVSAELSTSEAPIARVALEKMNSVLSKNPGLKVLKRIGAVLEGTSTDIPGENVYDANDVAAFKFAPITSCDVERIFSRFSYEFSERRRSFKFENLCMHTVLSANSAESEEDLE